MTIDTKMIVDGNCADIKDEYRNPNHTIFELF